MDKFRIDYQLLFGKGFHDPFQEHGLGTGPESTAEIESRQTGSIEFLYFLQLFFPVEKMRRGVVLLVNRGRA